MAHVTYRAFTETVDGVRSRFTTPLAIVATSWQIYQGALAIPSAAFLAISPHGVVFLDAETQQPWSVTSEAVIICEAHGRTTGDHVVVWSSDADGMPNGVVYGEEYGLTVVDADTLQFIQLGSGEAITPGVLFAGTLFLAQPTAPQPADGAIWFHGVTQAIEINEDEIIGLWSLAAFRQRYGFVEAEAVVLQDVLQDADDRVQRYVTAAAYAEALAQGASYRTIRRVIGELATLYAAQRSDGVRRVQSEQKSYADSTKSMSRTYAVEQSPILQQSEQKILLQLAQYARPSDTTANDNTFTAGVTWGSGRLIL